MKRIISLALCFMLVFTLCPSIFAATVWEVANAEQLETALNDFQSGDTIKLTSDIIYNKGIVIDGKNVTFDTGSFTLNVYSSTESSPGVGLEVKNGGNVYLIGSGQFDIRQMGGSTSYGVKATGGSTAIVSNIQVTVFMNDSAFGAYAADNNSSIQVLGNVRVIGEGGGCGAKTFGRGKITIDGTITAWTYINIGETYKDISSGVDDPAKPGYLKYSTELETGVVWVKAASVTIPDAPQNFTATPGDGQVALSWTAPVSDGGAAISKYEVSSDNGSTWGTAATNTSHTFTGLTNGTAYTFKVRAVNSEGNGAEASATATPTAAPAEYVCEIDGTGYPTLDAALTAVLSGETIRLLEDIDYNSGIVIENKRITFDLNGFNLNVLNTTGGETIGENSGLYVKGNAAVSLEGAGEFNVTGAWYGVFVECESEDDEMASATVTNATGIGRDGVAAQSSKVTVRGDVTSNGTEGRGVWASYENAEVIVEGNVYADGSLSHGVYADTLSVVTVEGDVIVNGNNSTGVMVQDDSDVIVEGNITVSGGNGTGVYLIDIEERLSFVTINGEITAPAYIIMDSKYDYEWNPDEGNYFAEESESHLFYSGFWGSTIYVAAHSGGSGTGDDPYLISNATQLNAINSRDGGKHYKLVKDIDLGGWYSLGEGWHPIGNGEVPFIGTLDGNGYTISNLRINRKDQNNVGLFACIGIGAEIRNVGLIDVDVTGKGDVGGLVGVNSYGLIIDSYVTGEVSGKSDTGGLTGYNEGSVTDSYFEGTVTATGDRAGGLVGDNYGSITGCHADATVESEGNCIGGLAGASSGTIIDSYAISTVTGAYSVGGLTGETGLREGLIDNSHALGNVTAISYVGGLIGSNGCTIIGSYFIGTVTSSDEYIGGLVGENRGGSISNCHADATVTGAGDYVGGLAGSSIGLITSSYSTGAVTGGSHVGGLVGASFSNAGSGETSEGISASYSSGAVKGEMYVGGLAGSNETPISESYAKGDVTNADEVDLTYTHFGGLVGKNTGPVEDSYAWGDVSGHQYVGGLIGYNQADITNCYEIGAVDSADGAQYVGPLVGYHDLAYGNITASFWNSNTSGHTEEEHYGIKSGSVAMKQQVTYVNEDWDFDAIWGIDLVQPSAFNDGYPFLKWQIGVPPVLSETGVDSVTDTTAALSFSSDKTGIYYYLVYDAAEDSPDAAAIKAQGEAAAKGTGIAEAAANNITVAGLTASTAYKAYIIVEYAEGNTSGVAEIDFITEAAPIVPTVPTAPQNFTAAPGDTQVALSWAAPASDGGAAIIRYEVSSDYGGIWIMGATNTSHTFTGLTNGTAYTFKVRAVNSVGSGAEASAAATPAATVTVYTVTINGSYAATTGAGSYAKDITINIYAGDRSGYTFAGWTSPDGVALTNANNATTTFTMPDKNVTITANWSYDGSGGGSSTPKAPAYKADVKAGSTDTTIPVKVDKQAGTASVDAGSRNLDQSGTIITMPSVPNVDTYLVRIPVPDLSTSEVQGTLNVNTDAGSVIVPSNMLTGVAHISGSKAEIAIGQGDKDNLPDAVKAAIGDRPLVQLTLSIDGKRTDWSNPDAPVTVSIPYTPTAAELANPESIVVWYIDGSGNVVTIPNGRYDPATGMVIFDTIHFSGYAVAYNKVSFNDVASGAWYAPAVSFIAAREITTGTGSGNYSPEARLSRGQFIVMLMKAYEMAPDANPRENFSDAGGTYYTSYLAAAKRLGISAGIGNNVFAPEKEITRQEMFTLLYNALKVIGQLPQGDSDKMLDHFSDAGKIDSWAKEAMALLVKTGTIGGDAGKLNPTSTTTRAEMAQVLYNLLLK